VKVLEEGIDNPLFPPAKEDAEKSAFFLFAFL